MKHRISAHLVMVLLFITSQVNAQKESESKTRFQFEFGFANTSHYGLANLNFCDEGCFPDEREARLSQNFNLGLFRKLNSRNEIKFGIGVSQYRHWEKGLASPGGPTLIPYEQTMDFNYYNFSIGHQYKFKSSGKIKPYLENSIIYDRLQHESNILTKGGLAIKTSLGALLKVSNKMYINLDGFFKSGITKYNKNDYSNKFIPFAYGIEFGVGFDL